MVCKILTCMGLPGWQLLKLKAREWLYCINDILQYYKFGVYFRIVWVKEINTDEIDLLGSLFWNIQDKKMYQGCNCLHRCSHSYITSFIGGHLCMPIKWVYSKPCIVSVTSHYCWLCWPTECGNRHDICVIWVFGWWNIAFPTIKVSLAAILEAVCK